LEFPVAKGVLEDVSNGPVVSNRLTVLIRTPNGPRLSKDSSLVSSSGIASRSTVLTALAFKLPLPQSTSSNVLKQITTARAMVCCVMASCVTASELRVSVGVCFIDAWYMRAFPSVNRGK
jgi:hypothetical protein